MQGGAYGSALSIADDLDALVGEMGVDVLENVGTDHARPKRLEQLSDSYKTAAEPDDEATQPLAKLGV